MFIAPVKNRRYFHFLKRREVIFENNNIGIRNKNGTFMKQIGNAIYIEKERQIKIDKKAKSTDSYRTELFAF